MKFSLGKIFEIKTKTINNKLNIKRSKLFKRIIIIFSKVIN